MCRMMIVGPAVLAAAACAPQPPDLEAERAALLRLDAEWSAAAAEGADPERVVAYWADAAVVVPPGQPVVRGREALLEMVRAIQSIPGASVSWESDGEVHFSPDGRMAWMMGRNEFVMPDSVGNPVVMPGRGVTIWEKDENGEWKCVSDIWNDAPAEEAVR